jgi:peptidoglycan/LPS O-acetylase OafA/YrhL
MQDLKITLPDEVRKTNFRALDGLRAVSIIIVIISHVLTAFPVNNTNVGAIGVYTFFVISGFLITTLLLKERLKYGNISLKGFYIRRAFRILPVAYLYLIVLICLNFIYKLNISGISFLSCFLFVKNLPFFPDLDWYTGHFWSLGTEEQFYLIFPFLIVFLSLRNYARFIKWAVVVLPILLLVYVNRLDTGLLHLPRVFHLALSLVFKIFGKGSVLILIGSLFSVLLLTQNKWLQFIYDKAPGYSSLLLFIIGLFLLHPSFPWYEPILSETIFGVIVAFVIILNLKENSLFSRLLELNFMKRLGILSYSIYVWQELFTYKQPWHNAGTNIFLIVLNLAVLVVVAWLSYSFYEKKFLRLKDRFKRV